MAYLEKGTVEALFIKALPKEDQYGKKFRASILIDKIWYGVGNTKTDHKPMYTKNGLLGKGAVVSFAYDEEEKDSRTYRSMKLATLEFTKECTEAVTSFTKNVAGKQNPNTTNTGSTPPQGANPAEVGQCMNLAVQLGLAGNYQQLLTEEVTKKAIGLYKAAKEQFSTLYPDVSPFNEPLKAPKPAPKAQNPDDDVPF